MGCTSLASIDLPNGLSEIDAESLTPLDDE